MKWKRDWILFSLGAMSGLSIDTSGRTKSNTSLSTCSWLELQGWKDSEGCCQSCLGVCCCNGVWKHWGLSRRVWRPIQDNRFLDIVERASRDSVSTCWSAKLRSERRDWEQNLVRISVMDVFMQSSKILLNFAFPQWKNCIANSSASGWKDDQTPFSERSFPLCILAT